jgi:hypothetical protein
MLNMGSHLTRAPTLARTAAMEMGGRAMPGMVIVPAAGLTDPGTFGEWITTAVDFARSEPPKPPKRAKS